MQNSNKRVVEELEEQNKKLKYTLEDMADANAGAMVEVDLLKRQLAVYEKIANQSAMEKRAMIQSLSRQRLALQAELVLVDGRLRVLGVDPSAVGLEATV